MERLLSAAAERAIEGARSDFESDGQVNHVVASGGDRAPLGGKGPALLKQITQPMRIGT